MGCNIYYLDQFRETIAEKKAEAVKTKIADAEELMQEAKVSMKILSERTAKLMLDLAFNKIMYIDDATKERLVRYADELCCKAKDDLNV